MSMHSGSRTPGKGQETYSISEADSGTRVQIHIDDIVEVILPGNPTSGFRWEAAEHDAKVLQMPNEASFQRDTLGTGTGGVYTLAFLAVGEGTTPLQLVYRRPFEKVEPARTFELTVVVERR
jgi:predicted secreted protein